jgi:hypothetical protein
VGDGESPAHAPHFPYRLGIHGTVWQFGLMDFPALCLTDFTDWRHIHSWLVFSTQLVNFCPYGRSNYTCVLFPLYLVSDLPPPSQTKCTVYRQYVSIGGGVEGVELCFRPYSARVLHSVSDQIHNLQNCFTNPNKITSIDDI